MIRAKVTVSGPGGFELPESRTPLSVPESRLLRLPLRSTPPTLGSYMLKSGRYVIRKSPGAALVYGVDLREWLADAGAALAGVTIDSTRGVSTVGQAFTSGTIVGALVEGLSLLEGAVNSCTFRFTCTDGQSDTVTIGFEKG